MISPAPTFSDELVRFLESGVSVLVATRSRDLEPSCMRGVGVRVDRARSEVTVFVPVGTSERVVADLRDGSPIAMTFSQPTTHRTVQLKGAPVSVLPAVEGDRASVEHTVARYVDELDVIGIPRSVTRRVVSWPCHAVRVKVNAMFDQTPGPRAGEPLAS